MASYPDNLLYYLKSMQGYSRNNVKILPLTQTAGVRQGDTMQFRLPTNSLIDLSTWTLHGHRKLTYPTGASGHLAMFGKDTASMVRGLQIQIGGQTIQNLDAYNVVWQALKDQTMSPAAEKCLGYLEGAYVNLKGGAGVNDIKVQKAQDSEKAPFIIRNWLGFFQASPSILDTALTGEIVVTIAFDPDRRNWAAGNASAAQCGFELEELYSTVDLISIQDGVYEMVARQALESGMMLEIPVPSYYKFESNNNNQSYTTRFTIGCQSLDAAMVLQRLTSRAFEDPLLHKNAHTGDLTVAVTQSTAAGVAIDESKIANVTAQLTPTQVANASGSGAANQTLAVSFASTSFPADSIAVTQPAYTGNGSLGIRHKRVQSGLQFNGSAATDAVGNGWYFEVNGAHVPSHRVRRSDTLHYNKIAFGVHGTDHGNLMSLALANRLDDDGDNNKAHAGPDLEEVFSTQFIPVMRFNHASSDKRLLSGIDCRSNPVQLSFTAVGAGTGGTSSDFFNNDKPRKKQATVFSGSELGSDIDTMVVALCTSTLMLGAGQQLSFSA